MPEIEYWSLTVETTRTNFSCGDGEIDKWFRKDAWKHHEKNRHIVTCASFDDRPSEIVGFYALSTVVESVAELGASVPFFAFKDSKFCGCLQLTYMAIRSDLQSQSHGELVLGTIVNQFASIGRQVGLPVLIVSPSNKRSEKFYLEKGGFKRYAKGPGLFMPVQQAIATLAAAEAVVSEEEA